MVGAGEPPLYNIPTKSPFCMVVVLKSWDWVKIPTLTKIFFEGLPFNGGKKDKRRRRRNCCSLRGPCGSKKRCPGDVRDKKNDRGSCSHGRRV